MVSYDYIMYFKIIVYRKKYSCEIVLIGLVEDWRLVLDNKQKVFLLLMDMFKVFDLVFFLLIVVKFGVYGFNDKLL